MIKPEQFDKIPQTIIKLYQELEDFIIEDICRRIAKVGKITDTAEWQIIRAQEWGMAQKTIKKKIASTLNKSEEEIDKLFEDAAILSTNQDNVLYEQAKLTPLHLETTPKFKTYLVAAIKQTKKEFKNISGSLGFVEKIGNKSLSKKLSQYYIDKLNFVQFQVSSGALDYQTAVRKAVKDLARSGVQHINYETGWHNRVDVAVKRATLTGIHQMSNKMMQYSFNQNVPKKEQYVEVTAHAGARPDHAEWQGQVFKVEGYDNQYKNLYEVTGLGTGEGLLGWNCRHDYFPFIPGTSVRAYNDEQLANIDPPPKDYNGKTYTYYEATQEQRKMERQIRQLKREIIGHNATGDKEAFTEASIKLQMKKKEYDKFSSAMNIRAKKERQTVNEFNRSISQKSVWSTKKVSE